MPPLLNLTIQWHITTNCGYLRQHCYMYDPLTWLEERQNSLDLSGRMLILDRISDSC